MSNYKGIIRFIAHPYFLLLSFSSITFIGEKLSFPFFIIVLGSFSVNPDTNYLNTLLGISGLIAISLCFVSVQAPFKKLYNLGVFSMLISLIFYSRLDNSYVILESMKQPITYCTIGIFVISAVLGLFTNNHLFFLEEKKTGKSVNAKVVVNLSNPNKKTAIVTIITNPITLLIFYLLIIIPDQGLPLPFFVLTIIGAVNKDIYAIIGLVGFFLCLVSRFFLTRFLHIMSIIMLNIPVIYILFDSILYNKSSQPNNPYFYVMVGLFMSISVFGLAYRVMPNFFVKLEG